MRPPVRKNRFLQKGDSYRKVRKRPCLSDMCLAEGSAHAELSIYLATLSLVAARGRYLPIAALYMAEGLARARQRYLARYRLFLIRSAVTGCADEIR